MEIKVISTMGRNVLAIFREYKEYIALAVEGDINRNTGKRWQEEELEEIVKIFDKGKECARCGSNDIHIYQATGEYVCLDCDYEFKSQKEMKAEKYPELRGCKEGEINIITKDFFCNLYCEFCKFIKCKKK